MLPIPKFCVIFIELFAGEAVFPWNWRDGKLEVEPVSLIL
jgi:hypothetical protein